MLDTAFCMLFYINLLLQEAFRRRFGRLSVMSDTEYACENESVERGAYTRLGVHSNFFKLYLISWSLRALKIRASEVGAAAAACFGHSKRLRTVSYRAHASRIDESARSCHFMTLGVKRKR